jgi:hypothetical protein
MKMLAFVQTALTEWALAAAALVCLIGAALAAADVPIVGRTIGACLVALGCGLAAYDFGHRAGAADGDKRLAALASLYNDEGQKAVLAQQAKDRAEADANARNARDAIDKLAAEQAATAADLAEAEAHIDTAPADVTCGGADASAPGVIIETIRGK